MTSTQNQQLSRTKFIVIVKFIVTYFVFMCIGYSAQLCFAQTSEPTDETDVVYDDSSGQETTAPSSENKSDTPPGRLTPTRKSTQTQHTALLSTTVLNPEPIWLAVGKQQWLAFWQPDQSGSSKGALLVLSAPGATVTATNFLQTVQSSLSKHGWGALVIQVPEYLAPQSPRPANPTPDNTTAPASDQSDAAMGAKDETQVVYEEKPSAAQPNGTEPAEMATETKVESSDEEEALPPVSLRGHLDLMNQSIGAGLAYLNGKSQYNIALMGVGQSAYIALEHLNQNSGTAAVTSIQKANQQAVINRAFQALILIAPKTPSDQTALPDLLTAAGLPLLDIGYKSERTTHAEKRKLAAKQMGYQVYEQMLTTPFALNATPKTIVKRVRGFLKRHATGVAM